VEWRNYTKQKEHRYFGHTRVMPEIRFWEYLMISTNRVGVEQRHSLDERMGGRQVISIHWLTMINLYSMPVMVILSCDQLSRLNFSRKTSACQVALTFNINDGWQLCI
jgi:hypothetical protein